MHNNCYKFNAGFTMTEGLITTYELSGTRSHWTPTFTRKEFKTKIFLEVATFLHQLEDVISDQASLCLRISLSLPEEWQISSMGFIFTKLQFHNLLPPGEVQLRYWCPFESRVSSYWPTNGHHRRCVLIIFLVEIKRDNMSSFEAAVQYTL